MFVTRQSLSRRTLLKGLGATVALPMLDAMLPAGRQRRTGPPRRGLCVVGWRTVESRFV